MGCACRVTPLRIFIQGLSQVHKIEPSYSLRLRVPAASVAPNCNQLRLTRLLHASRRLNQESNISAASSPLTATNSEGTAATTGEFSFTYENRSEPVEPAKTIEPPKTIKPVTTTKSTTTIEGPFAHENHNDSVNPAIPVKPPKKVEPVTVQPARTAEAVTTPEIVTTIEHTTSQPTTTTDFATANESPTASEPSNVKKSVEGYQQAQVDQPTEGAEIYKRKSTLPNSNFEYRDKFQGRDKFRGKDKFEGKDRLQVYKERRFRGDKPIGENKFKDKPWKPKSYLDDSLDESRPWKKRGDDTDSSWQPRKFKASSASFEPIVGRSPSEPAPDVPAWKIQKQALKEKFPDGWAPRKRLSPDALAGIRALNAQFPDTYTTSTLASRFEVSPENIRRILKGGWQPTAEEEKDRQDRWFRRGMKLWDHKAELGMKPPRKWRLEGIKRDPSYYDKRQGAIKRNRQLEEKDDREIQARFRKSVPSAGKY